MALLFDRCARPLAGPALLWRHSPGEEVDDVGASHFADNIKSLALRGRLMSVGGWAGG